MLEPTIAVRATAKCYTLADIPRSGQRERSDLNAPMTRRPAALVSLAEAGSPHFDRALRRSPASVMENEA